MIGLIRYKHIFVSYAEAIMVSYAENGLEIHEEDNNCYTILALTMIKQKGICPCL